MGSARKLQEISPQLSLTGLKDRSEFYRKLRTYYHSLHADDRDEAIDILSHIRDSDSAKELIQIYQDCQWRSTRFKIVRALALNPSQRSLEFLFHLARTVDDIPLAEEAISALGQTKHLLAARFLASLYRGGPELCLPAVVGAISQIPDQNLASEFLRDLPTAIGQNRTLLARNLTLALGELKCKEAWPLLEKIVTSPVPRQTVLGALISMGKIGRDPKALDSLERFFRKDLFEHQVFLGVRNQVLLRSQWSLNDYVNKIFEKATDSKALAVELNLFEAREVKEALQAFAVPENFEKLALVLSALGFPHVSHWYTEFFDIPALTHDKGAQALESLTAHHGSDTAITLNIFKELALKTPEKPVFEKWLEAVSLCLPDAEIQFKQLIQSPQYKTYSETKRISVINHLMNFALTMQCRPERLKTIGEVFATLASSETGAAIHARIIRACATLGLAPKDVFSIINRRIHEPPLTRSCIDFLEACPGPQSLSLLLELIGDDKARIGLGPSLIKGIKAQQSVPQNHDGIDKLLRENLSKNCAVDSRYEALMFLGKHPRNWFIKDVLSCLSGVEQLKLGAIIALKALGDEQTAEALAPCLEDNNESVVGRTLDTLTSLPGLKARHIVIDYLKDNPDDLEVCDKVVRSLTPTETPTPYVAEVIRDLLTKYPNHPRLEELILLKDRFEVSATTPAETKASEDWSAIDQLLTLKVQSYPRLNDAAKNALRKAEVLFQNLADINPSGSILGFCNAVQIALEDLVGKKIFFPLINSSFHEFQNVIHMTGLTEDFAVGERVARALGLERYFSNKSLPLQKMKSVGKGITSGKITLDGFNILDGLRAWAVLLLLFARPLPDQMGQGQPLKALIPARADEDQIIEVAKKLMALQDACHPENPEVKIIPLAQVREEALSLLNTFTSIF